MYQDPFKEYIRQAEPNKKYKGYAWSTAIGLQAVDGLQASEHLVQTAIENIEGNITMEDAERRINSYYEANPTKHEDDRTEEADKVSVRIASVLSEKAFTFSPSEYIGIHRKLFFGIYKYAGKIRDYNITKKEWVLDGKTVLYGNAAELRETLEYDFEQERKYSYKGLSTDEIIQHLAYFISRLWQIHIFGEGNTRTTAVFFIKYLRSLGYDATNDIFAENAWYFRNALVRANYSDLKNNVHETTVYLEKFIRNLLLGEKNELKNRYLHIDNIFDDEKPIIEKEKPLIDAKKPLIDILEELDFTEHTKQNIITVYNGLKDNIVFGRKDICNETGLGITAAGELLHKLQDAKLIEQVSGHGKGKYKFII